MTFADGVSHQAGIRGYKIGKIFFINECFKLSSNIAQSANLCTFTNLNALYTYGVCIQNANGVITTSNIVASGSRMYAGIDIKTSNGLYPTVIAVGLIS